MRVINSWKNIVKVTLFCLMLVSLFLRLELITVATPYYFSIEATRTQNPHFGYYGGYHDIWAVIIPELDAIGIELTTQDWDDYSWWDQVWEDGWNYTGDNPYIKGVSPGGWDVTMLEWWLQPHALEPWFASMVLNNQTPIEEGFNIHPWMNERADRLLLTGLLSFDANTRKSYLWAWQDEFMHDPPIAEIYYPRVFEAMGSYVLGYDPGGCWWYDITHLDINETAFDLYVTKPERIAQGKDTLIYAITEEIWNWNPMFMDTYTEEQIGSIVYDTLYKWSLDYTDAEWLTAGVVEPDWEDYIILPELAADYPTPLEGGKRMRVPLREDVLWSDGAQFNATDVKFTFDLTFNPTAKCSGVGDFAYAIESVEVVPDPLGTWDPYTEQLIDPYMVDFVLHAPHPDFISIISNDWGGGSIVPWHVLKDTPPQQIKIQHPSNSNWDQMLPGTGPFKVTGYGGAGTQITLERNDLHWGYGLGQGPYVSKLILQWVPIASQRLTALQTNTVDFGEYPIASISTYLDMMTWDNVRVYQYDYPASNGVWFNFNNLYLSNRYVRLAIAHAIPYDTILGILETWGIQTAYPGIAYVQPMHYYAYGGTKVHLFNDDLEPYFYDIPTAQAYLNMWLYSQPAYAPPGSAEVDLGPVGDADFSGRVNFDDLWTWRENVGKSPAQWPWIPGLDVDPDFNNDEAVTAIDFDLWFLNYGNQYPFAGAR